MAATGTHNSSTMVVYAALAGNLAIAVTKFVAFALTGSSAMLTEAIHSSVDTGNQGLLLLGLARARKPPSETHPFGYGMEVYFWAFVVALLIFALGGAFSIYEGVLKIFRPEPIERAWINFLVVGLATLFEGGSFLVAWKEFRVLTRGTPLLRAIRRSKDPSVFAVLLEDGAALAGLAIAALGVAGSAVFGIPWADGAASVAIGVLLVLVAIFLANETRSLLTGESASPRIVEEVRQMLAADPRVDTVAEVLSMHLGPQEILLGVTLDFHDDLTAGEIEDAADDFAVRIRTIDERITRVFVRSGRARAAYARPLGA
ncbi:cation transporter [Caulobacter sp. Root1455]|jgi:cation diffusion facilitator family transporter|uniref:cation diffusion facilitator family transporter n=1 Tax=unclassified Caulobacter TaxID=2648921 RepID=UPI0006F4D75C|nr:MULTISPECIES: cation diffusion facilitator family transporter [unclassified Caulobacter]KQY29613.1 cation transporter [Caulobacter sp. Root487D2Y]KQY95805.1 cation transporter [Caulobacter sp. Root1455]